MSENNRRAVAIFAGFFAGLYPYFDGTYLASSLTALAVTGIMYAILGRIFLITPSDRR